MTDKVLIIGGGISGLALAQVLRNNNINFEIFERDLDHNARSQGWTLGLRECLAGMYQLFPKDLPPLEPSVTVFCNLPDKPADFQVNFGAVDYQTGESQGKVYDMGTSDLPRHIVRASRTALREWLSTNLKITWGKRLERYEESETGVTAHFTDGTFAEGTILIAADGSRSKVRTQMVGHERAQPIAAPIGAVNANIILGEADYKLMLELGNAFIISSSPNQFFFMGAKDFDPAAKTAEYFWSICWDEAEGQTSGSVVKGNELHGEEARQYALKRCSDLHPSLRRFIEKTTGDQMTDVSNMLLQWAFHGADELPAKRVTMIGDALHQMVPFRGAGANTAILDAFDIAQLLVEARNKGKDFAAAIKPYERIAVPRGRAMVGFSRSVGLSPDPTHWIKMMKQVFEGGYEWKLLPELL